MTLPEVLDLIPSQITFKGNFYALYITKYFDDWGCYYQRILRENGEVIFFIENDILEYALIELYEKVKEL